MSFGACEGVQNGVEMGIRKLIGRNTQNQIVAIQRSAAFQSWCYHWSYVLNFIHKTKNKQQFTPRLLHSYVNVLKLLPENEWQLKM